MLVNTAAEFLAATHLGVSTDEGRIFLLLAYHSREASSTSADSSTCFNSKREHNMAVNSKKKKPSSAQNH